ncbi:mediator of DNA damage checkpoint protein 1 [Mitosporidium daphniae]|uniref:Mediator of DNA damage checkpoint protein 1 n=1 Tax=Mitosporidium daphniae TaxID=1485682 RepID=A0A098VSB8_9MICR|nr:mediator of DNA damage checkpoint protein 1 [Mitosporidium daphniae]KGG51857.1 mediator of DNA damage checkpoint protein 1 [Mitosporidium daphniae]|eukprot:XP_013238284.1 mediator of DNA damage checkpoint protein 1 [Mitosporidium daphniae]
MLRDAYFLPLNYGYIFDAEDPHTRSLASSLISSAEKCGATFISCLPPKTAGRKIYILTPVVEKTLSSFPQVTLFWLVDQINNLGGYADASPLHAPRDPQSPRWKFLCGHVATLSGYRGRDLTLVRALLAAAGAVTEAELDVERTTLLIAERDTDTQLDLENIHTALALNIPIRNRKWLMDQFAAATSEVSAPETRGADMAANVHADTEAPENQHQTSIGVDFYWQQNLDTPLQSHVEEIHLLNDPLASLDHTPAEFRGAALQDPNADCLTAEIRNTTCCEENVTAVTDEDKAPEFSPKKKKFSPKVEKPLKGSNADTISESPRGRRRKSTCNGPCISVTGFKLLASEIYSWEAMGGSIAASKGGGEELLPACTHLFLLAVARGVTIVSKEWLLDSIALGTFELDVESYALKDSIGEGAFGFILSESLSRARSFVAEQGLFTGITFRISQSCVPGPSLLVPLILECKGRILECADEKEHYYITCSPQQGHGIQRTPDWVLRSVLQQTLLEQ